MTTKFQSIWDAHLCLINVAKPRIEPLNENTQPVYTKQYRAGPKIKEPEKSELEKKEAQIIIERAQAEWEAPILFVPMQDRTLHFCTK